jgi:hypothetical protein
MSQLLGCCVRCLFCFRKAAWPYVNSGESRMPDDNDESRMPDGCVCSCLLYLPND